MKKNKYIIKPNIKNYSLMQKIKGFDYEGKSISTNVINEKPLTIYLNNQEIVTLMTINDFPKYLAIDKQVS